ncbi:hypothetical protein TRVA0_087S00232 [Trichomonascus vanleenenianus]|uniref:uncharacterized protein n=1 Tax=Trichomonascus vanleenenianus TaxID=2268995 RepID=UPI003ECA70B9
MSITVSISCVLVLIIIISRTGMALPAWCTALANHVAVFGRARSKIVWVTYTSVTVYSICKIIGYDSCLAAAGAWGATLALIVNLDPVHWREAHREMVQSDYVHEKQHQAAAHSTAGKLLDC